MKTTVLVVEDEQDTAELLKCVLERTGFLVTHAKDGRQATTLIETTRAPSLVLLDMVIPYVSGIELLRVIRRHPDWQGVPVIMLSADDYEPDIQQALREGATAYVTKQKGSAGLLQAVTRLLPATLPQDQIVPTAGRGAPRTRRASVPNRLRSTQRKKRAA